jgi:hypothetical protein
MIQNTENGNEYTFRKMPVGVQDFEKLRTGNNVYVDKTQYIYISWFSLMRPIFSVAREDLERVCFFPRSKLILKAKKNFLKG